MRKILLFLFISLSNYVFGNNQDSTFIEVDKAGSLSKILGDSISKITNLTLNGYINSDDIATLRYMLGKSQFGIDNREGKLAILDMSDAHIRKGGDGYYINENHLCCIEENDVLGNNAFSECDKLKKIILPKSLVGISEWALSHCDKLQSVYMYDSVQFIDKHVFYSLESLTNIRLSDNIQDIPMQAFSGCKNLTKIEIPSKVTYIGDNAFWDCPLKYISIPDSTEELGNWIFGLSKIERIDIGKKLRYIGEGGLSCGYDLKEITVSKENPFLESINGCLISNEEKNVIIYANASNQKICQVPEDIKTIRKHAFFNLKHTRNIILPSTLEEIEQEAIDTQIDNLYLKSSNPVFIYPNSINIWNEELNVYVPDELFQEYAQHDLWKDYNIKHLSSSPVSIQSINEDYHEISISRIGKYLILKNIDKNTDIRVYDFKGIMRYQGKSNGQDTRINLPKGKYIIECGKERFKISL